MLHNAQNKNPGGEAGAGKVPLLGADAEKNNRITGLDSQGFIDAIRQALDDVPPSVEPGKMQRFGPKKALWCKLFDDGQAGVFGDWRTGYQNTWHSKNGHTPMLPGERHKLDKQIREAQEQARQERQARQAKAAARAQRIWDNATPADPRHGYLIKKGIQPHGARQSGQALVVPVVTAQGSISSLQFVSANGQGKKFLPDGAVGGGFFLIGEPGQDDAPLCICEGFATGATVYEATGYQVAVAFNAGNLEAVAKIIRAKNPARQIIVCGDNDHCKEGNPGLTKARAAAKAINGRLVYPVFVDESTSSDFNDLAIEYGLEAVKETLEKSCLDPQHEIDWPDPEPLPDELLPVAPFEIDLLPQSIAPWVQDVCKRMQCPPDFVGVAVITCLACVIGRKVTIRPQQHDDWTVVCNLWSLVVGRPGVLKSPALESALSPLKRLVALAQNTFDEQIAEYETQARLAKLEKETAEKAAKKILEKGDADKSDLLALLSLPEVAAPAIKRYMTTDTTPEALIELSRQNPNGLLVYRDELVSLLKSMDREDRAELRGIFLTGWNGDSGYTVDRIGRGFNLRTDALCLSLLGGTQPGRLSEYVSQAHKGGQGDDGLIQRFGLLVWPDITGWKNIDLLPDNKAKNNAFRVFEYLNQLDPKAIGAQQDTDPDGNPEGLPYLHFDTAAQELFREWRTTLENEKLRADLHPALESHLAKYRKLIPALALIGHLAEGFSGPIGEGATLKALAWGDYLESHAKRVYASVTQPAVGGAKALLRRIKRGDIKSPFTARDVYRNHWTGLADKDATNDALALLVEHNWLRQEQMQTGDTGGRPTIVYYARMEATT